MNAPAATRILVAWRPDSLLEAIEYAAWLTRTSHAVIRVVFTFPRAWPTSSLPKLSSKYQKWKKKEQAAFQRSVSAALEHVGIDHALWDKRVAVFVDGPSEHVMLTEAAQDFGADLILMGPGAAAPKGKFLATSAADTMLHSSPIPLGLSPRAAKFSKRGVRRVNFAYLDTETSADNPTLLYAARLAHCWQVPLRILAFSPSGIVDSPIYDKMGLGTELLDDWREQTLALLDRATDKVAHDLPDVEITSQIAAGSGWGGAVDAVKWKKSDLLCLGSAPIGPIERVFVGSTTTEFLHHVPVPVIVNPERID